jgi:peptidoglycan hydrolase-like protein with peptidoglycan-binding domain
MKAQLQKRLGKVLAIGGGLAVLLGGGAYALVGHGSDAGATKEIAGDAPSSSSLTSRLQPPTSVTTIAPTTTTTEAVTTTTEAPAKPQPSGSVKDLQQRLADLGYDVGTIDGLAGTQTYYAIMAFQKVEGLDRTGEDSDALRAALATASKPGPMVPGGAADRVEVDLDRQVLFLWKGGSLARILPVSTGSGEYYCVDGDCDTAITPTGSFHIGRKAAGLEISPLGELWSPSYFYGGIAIHGSPSIPPYPASHGCVRVPMYAATSLYDQLPTGMAVYVVGNGPPAADVPPPPDNPTSVSNTPPPTDSVPTTTPPTTAPPVTAPPTTAPTTVPSTALTTVPSADVPPVSTTVPAPTSSTSPVLTTPT